MITEQMVNEAGKAKMISETGKAFIVREFFAIDRADIAEVLSRCQLSTCLIYGINLLTEEYQGPPCRVMAIATGRQSDTDFLDENICFVESFMRSIGYCFDWFPVGSFND